MKTLLGANIQLISTLEQLNAAVEEVKDFPLLSVDTETCMKWTLAEEAEGKPPGIDHNRIKLRSIQFGDTNIVYVLDCALVPNWLDSTLPSLLIGSQMKVAHNSSFERKCFLNVGIDLKNLCCTMISEQLLFQGLLMKRPSLVEVAEKYCGIEMPKEVRDTFVYEQEVLPLREEQIEYAANDVDLLIPIFQIQKRELEALNLWKVAKFEYAVRAVFDKMELRGVKVDTVLWQKIYDDFAIEHEQIKSELFQQFRADAVIRWEQTLHAREAIRALWETVLDDPTASPERREEAQKELDKLPSWLKKRSNPEGKREPKKTAMWHFDKVLTSAMQMKEVFALNGIEVTDTNERTLLTAKYFKWGDLSLPNYPTRGIKMIENLLTFRELDKRLTTYGPGWLRYSSPVSQRIHPEYDTIKETARTGCQRPNIQNVPKRGSGTIYRTAFVPGDGNVFVVSDYSQIELRMAAEHSQDKAMLDAFKSGEDFHTVTASMMFHIPLEEFLAHKDEKEYKDKRRAAKAVNFGIIFGIGPKKLSEQITFDSGILCKQEEAQSYLSRYATSYPQLMQWLRKQEQVGQHTLCAYTKLGHRRQFTPLPKPLFQPKGSARYAEYEEAKKAYTMRMGGIGRESKNTPIQGCILGYNRILVAGEGYQTIESLVNRTDVQVWDGQQYVRADVLPSGLKQRTKVTLWDGNTIECSPDHKFWITDVNGRSRWVRAEDLVPNRHYVQLTDAVPDFECSVAIPERLSVQPSFKNISLNQFQNTHDLGVFLGRVASDGSVNKRGVTTVMVAEHEENIMPEVTRLISELGYYGYAIRETDLQPKRFHNYVLRSTQLVEQLLNMGIKSRVPDPLWSTKEGLRGYLRGMFDGDGTVNQDGATLCFGKEHTHLKWAQEIQQALFLFAIRSRVNCPNGRVNVRILKADMPKFATEIGFMNVVKQHKALAVTPGDRDANGGVSKIYGRSIRVKSVEVTDDWVEMYDVCDSDTHQFMCQGLVTHNTAACVAKTAMLKLEQILGKYNAGMVAFIHDEIVVECPKENAEEVLGIVKRTMVNAGRQFMEHCPCEVDAHIAMNWLADEDVDLDSLDDFLDE